MSPFEDIRFPGRPPVLPEKAIERIRALAKAGARYAGISRMIAAEFRLSVSPEYCSLIARGKARTRPSPR